MDGGFGTLRVVLSIRRHDAEQVTGNEHIDVPVELRFPVSTSVSEAVAALLRDFANALPKGAMDQAWRLLDSGTGLAYPDDAPLAACQIVHGQRLLMEPRDGGTEPLELPWLGDEEPFRLVHETGAQLGLAWPVRPGQPLGLSIQDHHGVTLAVPGHSVDDADLAVQVDSGGHGITIITRGDLSVEDAGWRVADGEVIMPGSLVTLSRDSVELAPKFRLLRRSEHITHAATLGSVPYRVQSTGDLAKPQPTHSSVRVPRLESASEWSWWEHIATQLPMLVFLVAFSVFGGRLWMLFIAPVVMIPLVVRWWRHSRDQKKRIRQYLEDTREVDRTIGETLRAQVDTEAVSISHRSRPLSELSRVALDRGSRLWERGLGSDAFLQVAIGRGTYISESTVEFSGERAPHDGSDRQLAVWRSDAEITRLITGVPFEVDLLTKHLAVVGSTTGVRGVVRDLVSRIALQHSPNNLGIALILPSDQAGRRPMESLAWLPHLRSATSLWGMTRISFGASETRRVLVEALESTKDDVSGAPHLLLLVNDASGVDAGMLEHLVATSKQRIHVIWYGGAIERVPAWVTERLRLRQHGDGSDAKFEGDYTSTSERADHALENEHTRVNALPSVVIEPWHSSAQFCETALRSISCLVDESGGISRSSIPHEVPLASVLPEMLIQDLDARGSLVAVPGIGHEGNLEIDLHEEGPHFAVVGTTGAGKSEFLRSFVLSLAARYVPTSLAIMLIDFKGGALENDLSSLPHSVGMVTNLDSRDVTRLVDFLNAELRRRQRLLAPYGGEYTKFIESNPGGLPRLLVVIDEYASFLGEVDGDRTAGDDRETAVISLAQRGRSLGVHMIIATQSPQSVIKERLLANLNGRIALRVLEPADSVRLLGEDIAATIPRALKGRGFTRTEAGLVREFQTAYAGSTALARVGEADASATPFDPLGVRVPSFDAQTTETSRENDPHSGGDPSLATDGKVLRSRLKSHKRAPKRTQPRLRQSLIGDSFKDEKAVKAMIASLNYSGTSLPLGVRDVPRQQSQEIAHLDVRSGGVLLSGTAASGRTTLLLSLARWAKALGWDVVSIDGVKGPLHENMQQLATWNLHSDDRGLFAHLLSQLNADYRQERKPVLLLIDRLDHLPDLTSDVDRFAKVVADGGRRGVFVVTSTDPRLRLEGALARAFAIRLALDASQPGMLVEESEGGHLVRVPRFSTPHKVHTSQLPSRALGVPDLRSYRTIMHANRAEPGVQVAVDLVRDERVAIRVGPGLFIAGGRSTGKTTTLLTIAHALAEKYGKRVPVLLPHPISNAPDWILDIHEFSRVLTPLNGSEYLSALMGLTDIVPIFFLDELARIKDTMANIANQNHVTEWLNAMTVSLSRRECYLVATDQFSTIATRGASALIPSSMTVSTNLLHLVPSSGQDEAAALHRFTTADRERFFNPAGMPFGPGQGAFIEREFRRDVAIMPANGITELVGLMQNEGNEF